MSNDPIVIIGAGPAGIACGYRLTNTGDSVIIIEKDLAAGGMCQTVNYHGYLFDIGGHRFISDSEVVNRLWQDIMGGDLLRVRRKSRIYYRKKYFNYPLSLANAFLNLGPWEAIRCVESYVRYKYFRKRDISTFDGWIIKHFGKRLFEIFFENYTEKIWGIPCQNISADWARQRIRGLSLQVAIKKALFKNKRQGPKTLTWEFMYPKYGPGEFYDRLMHKLISSGTKFKLGHRLCSIKHEGGKVRSILIEKNSASYVEDFPIRYLFSSMPLPELINSLNPPAPVEIVNAARRLLFRSFLVVNVILDKSFLFLDQWIYVHSPEVRVARIQNFKNWSQAMIRDQEKTSLGIEYFCNQGDWLWSMNDIDLVKFAMEEIEKLGIACRKHLINAFVVRRENAYPICTLGYQNDVRILKEYLAGFSNLQTMGRAGLFRYDNSDHALLTGMFAADNLLNGHRHDIWSLPIDEG